MKSITSHILGLIAVMSFGLSATSQIHNQSSLLWRISGNGLNKPSYLFGTMHVYDKKAFNFKDSLYTFLEQAEGFALEFDPDSANQIIEAYLNGSIKTDDEQPVRPDISSSDWKLLEKKAISGKGKDAKQDQQGLIDYYVARLVSNDRKQKTAMNTFMDAFLYEIAKQYDKKMYGLETLNAQIAALTSLSRGLKIKRLVSLLEKWQPENESPVEGYYFRENIDSINIFYTTYFTEETLNDFLYARNIVMAGKIDSLARLQSMFAAVGAGHLAGDKGIIALLRAKGYAVEPVFSSQKILASDYKVKKVERPHYLVQNEELGLQYEMPGKPSKQKGEAGKLLVYYYDLGAGVVYMTISAKVSNRDSADSPEQIATRQVGDFVSKIGGNIISSKLITVQGLRGLESLCMGKGSAYYRLRVLVSKKMVYVFSLSAQKKDNLYTENVEQYLASFKSVPIPSSNWSSYQFADDGFRISFPGTPRIEPVQGEERDKIALKSYSFLDANSGVNYTISAGKTKACNEYVSNTSFFESNLEQIRSSTTLLQPVIEDTTVNGFPAKQFTRPSQTNTWKGLVIKRDHTSYFLVAEFEPGAGEEQAKTFLNSFSLTEYRKPDWQLRRSPSADFSSWTPSGIQQTTHDSSDVYSKVVGTEYYAYDPYSAITYFMDADPINEYYWARHEDSIYSYWKNKVVNAWTDSLVSYSKIRIGNKTGRELIYVNKRTEKTRKQRLLLNGSTMYSLYTTVPHAFADKADLDLFFDSFKLAEERSSNEILNNSPEKLFADLRSKDSATFQKAYDALSEVTFDDSQLVLLLEKAMLEYPSYENNYRSVNEILLSTVTDLFENAEPVKKQEVIDFIADHYSLRKKVVEEIRFSLLAVLASYKTADTYGVIKKLLAQRVPSKGTDFRLFGAFSDSLSLTRVLYPDILQYIADTTMGMPVAALTKMMIDSNIISIDVLQSKKMDVLKLARRQLKYALKVKEDDDYSYDGRIPDLVSLMGMMKQKEMDDLVLEFLKVKPMLIKKAAVLALLKNNRPANTAALNQIAADKYQRVDLYDDLQKMDKANLFPAAFRSQQKLAESYIYQSLVEDNDGEQTNAEFIYIKKIESEYKGEKKRFYFFRINLPGSADSTEIDGETSTSESYLAIAGPFELDARKPNVEWKKNITGIYYDEKFDGMMMDEYFKKFIEERSKWQQ